MNLLAWIAVVAWAMCFWEQPAHAYLDPGTGSMLLQLILGGVAAVGVALRLFWQRLSGGLRRREHQE